MSEWLQVKNLEMLVSKSELNLDISKNSDFLLFSCDLLNIARGRCEVKILKCLNKTLQKKLFISSKKAIMRANIELDDINFTNINNTFFKYRSQVSKKIKISLLMDRAVATSSSGILNLEKDLETKLQDIHFDIPIF